jgi:membrane protease YdiL (CAAX protease family)
MILRNTLAQLGLQSVGVVVIGAVVYGLTRALRLRYQGWPFDHPRRAALWGLGAILVGWLLVSVLFVLWVHPQSMPQGVSQGASGERGYTLGDVISQALLAAVAFGPAVLAMRLRRESWASARVSSHNLGGSLVVGTAVALFTVAATFFGGERGLGEVLAGISVRHLWALIYYAVVGFGEEFAFRGYLQTRLVAWLGRWQGWIVASALMALAHIVQRMTVQGLPPLDALVSSASLIPISLFMGYLLLRTENIVAPGLAHTFANWVGTLG